MPFGINAMTPDEIDAFLKSQRVGLLSLTDTNVLYGAIAFDKACRAVGVQAIIGMTLTVTTDPPAQLVLLATGPAGYRSLCRLSSRMQSSPQRETLTARGLDWDDLKANREGLICLSGGRRGVVDRLVRAGDDRAAYTYAAHLAGIFDRNAFLAIELHRAEDVAAARQITNIGERLGLPCVAVQPVYTLSPKDTPQLTLSAAINRKSSGAARNCHASVPSSARRQ